MDGQTTIDKLLRCGIAAGPFYLIISFLEILTRPGFDITRHSWSLLSNGDLGWVHIANFYITGLLVILGAIGIRLIIKGQKAGTWGPLMLGLYGLGLISAGYFVADPMDGFPVGTPLGMPTVITTSGILHLVSGAIGFIGLIAACFIFARRFSSLKETQLAKFSKFTGTFFLLAFIGISMGSGVGGVVLRIVVIGFILAVVVASTWISVVSWHLLKTKK